MEITLTADYEAASCSTGVTPNGLTVIAQHFPGAQCAATTLTVSCGFVDEMEHERGFAHLLEHLLHQWGRGEGGTQIDAEVHRLGGVSNARTYRHHTEYTAVAPVNATWWRSAASRLSWPEITDEAVESEVRVIAREVDEATLDRPLGVFPWLQLPAAMFSTYSDSHDPFTSPTAVTGAHDQALIDFHRRTHTPARAVLAITGALDPEVILAELHASPVKSPPIAAVVRRTSDCRRHLIDVDTQLGGTARAEARELDLPGDIVWRAASMVAAQYLSDSGIPAFTAGLFGPLRGPDWAFLVGTDLTVHGVDRAGSISDAVARGADTADVASIIRARSEVDFAIQSESAGTASHSAHLAREHLFGHSAIALSTALHDLDPALVITVLRTAADAPAGSVTITGLES